MSLDIELMLQVQTKLGRFRFFEKLELCHYSDLAGLMGIVDNCKIWLSDHRFFNDASEHSYLVSFSTLESFRKMKKCSP